MNQEDVRSTLDVLARVGRLEQAVGDFYQACSNRSWLRRRRKGRIAARLAGLRGRP